jgi:hypothetical protein
MAAGFGLLIRDWPRCEYRMCQKKCSPESESWARSRTCSTCAFKVAKDRWKQKRTTTPRRPCGVRSDG